MLIVATLRTGEPHDGRGAARRAGRGPGHGAGAPRAAGRRGDGGPGAAAARRARPTTSFVAACHRTTGGNPLLLRQLLRALAGRGRPAGRVARRHGERDRLPRRVEHGADAARPAARRLHRGRPRARRARRRRELPAVAALAELDETTPRRRHRGAGPGRGAARPDRPLGFVHPLVGEAVYQRTVQRRAGALPRARGRRADGRRVPRPSRWPRTSCSRRGAGRPAGGRGCCATAAATAAERGAADVGRAPTWSGRWPSRRQTTSGPTLLRRARPARDA